MLPELGRTYLTPSESTGKLLLTPFIIFQVVELHPALRNVAIVCICKVLIPLTPFGNEVKGPEVSLLKNEFVMVPKLPPVKPLQ